MPRFSVWLQEEQQTNFVVVLLENTREAYLNG